MPDGAGQTALRSDVYSRKMRYCHLSFLKKYGGLARTRTNYDIFEARNKQKVGILDYFCSVFRGESRHDIMSEFIFSDVL